VVAVGRWGGSLLHALLLGAATYFVCAWLGGRWAWVPPGEVLWTMAFGSFLIAGALAVAWAEKRLLAEHQQQYAAMAPVYAAAGRRIEGHLSEARKILTRPETAAAADAVRAAPGDPARAAR